MCGLVIAALATVGAARAEGTAPVVTTARPPMILLPCLSAPANATTTLGAGAASATLQSPLDATAIPGQPPKYGGANCNAFIAEFAIGSSAAQAPQAFSPQVAFSMRDLDHGGTPLAGISVAQCPTVTVRTLVYEKAAGSAAFFLVGGGTMHGAEQVPIGGAAGCYLVNDPGFVSMPTIQPPALGTDTYRVVASVDVGVLHDTIQVSAYHPLAISIPRLP